MHRSAVRFMSFAVLVLLLLVGRDMVNAADQALSERVEAGEEAKGLGIGYYSFEVREHPRVSLLDSNGESLGIVDIEFGPAAGEQLLDLRLADGRQLRIRWAPAEGTFELKEPSTGRRMIKVLDGEEWKIAEGDSLDFEEFEREISIAGVAAADYLRYIGHGSGHATAAEEP